jgi:hypothetical protein
MATITFKPKQVSKNLLAVLPDRARDVVTDRFGLGKETRRRTLESIGGDYGITRERVRQIENFALQAIKKSPAYETHANVFDELHEALSSSGSVVAEEDLFPLLAKDALTQNHIHFLFVLNDAFERKKEDQHYRHRWIVDHEISQKVHQALHNLYQSMTNDDVVTEDDILRSFKDQLSGVPEQYLNDQDTIRMWLNLSKVIGANPLGEWGLSHSPNINARGVRDYAYLILRRHGSPLHFTEVAKQISRTFGRPAHVATCHNELIKDKDRFVLVGRGLYGLAEWGYTNGVLRDVIISILQDEGPMTREDLVARISKERHVKPNTIFVNLQNKKYFSRNDGGKYVFVG